MHYSKRHKLEEAILKNVSRCVKNALLEYNGNDAIVDAENSEYKQDSVEFNDILKNGRSSRFYKKAPAAGTISEFSVSDLNFAKCFMMFDYDSNSVSVFGYNKIFDLCDLYGIDFNDNFYNELDSIEAGESLADKDKIYTRIK